MAARWLHDGCTMAERWLPDMPAVRRFGLRQKQGRSRQNSGQSRHFRPQLRQKRPDRANILARSQQKRPLEAI